MTDVAHGTWIIFIVVLALVVLGCSAETGERIYQNITPLKQNAGQTTVFQGNGLIRHMQAAPLNGPGTIDVRLGGRSPGSTYDAFLTCAGDASQEGSTQRATINEDGSASLQLSLTGGANCEPQLSTCTVHAYDVNQPDDRDDENISVTLLPYSALCRPGELHADGTSLQRCNDYGSCWTTIRTCPGGIVWSANYVLCKP